MKANRKKGFKKFLWILAATLFLLVGAGLLALSIFQDGLRKQLVEEVNRRQTGKLVVRDSHLELFKTFPQLSLDLQDVVFYPSAEEGENPVYQVADLYLGFSLPDLLRGKLNIKKLRLEGGKIDIVHYEDGSWNILKAKGINMEEDAGEGSGEESPLQLNLSKVVLKDILVEKSDLLNRQYFRVKIDRVEAGLSFQEDTLASHIESSLLLEEITVDGSSFFRNKHLDLHWDIGYDLENGLLQVAKSDFELENAALGIEGEVDVANDMDMQLRIFGRKPDFSLLLAFAPEETVEQLLKYQNAGQVFFNGRVTGKSVNGHTPRIDLEFGCENAWFLKPEENKKLDDVKFKGFFTNGSKRNLQTCELKVENLSMKPVKGFFTSSFHLRNFEAPVFLIDLHADIDLKEIGEFFDLENFADVSGRFKVDMQIDELIDLEDTSATLKKIKDAVNAQAVMEDLNFKLPGYPHVFRHLNARMNWQGGDLQIESLEGKIAENHLQMSGKVTNLSSIVHGKNAPVTLWLNADAKRLNLRELANSDSVPDEELQDLHLVMHFDTEVAQLLNFTHLPRGEFFIDTLSAGLKHYAHYLNNWHADLLIDSTTLVLKDFSGQLDHSDFLLTATLQNYPALFDTVDFTRNIMLEADLVSGFISTSELFTYRGKNPLPEEYRNERVRGLHLHFSGQANNGGLLHSNGLPEFQLNLQHLSGLFENHNIPLQNFAGNLKLKENSLQIEQMQGQIGHSDFALSGKLTRLDANKVSEMGGSLQFNSRNLDIDQLIAYSAENEQAMAEKYGASYHDSTLNIFASEFPDLRLQASIGQLHYHKYDISELFTSLHFTPGHVVEVDTLRLLAANGHFGLKGEVNGRDKDSIIFKSTAWLKGMSLDKIAYKMDNFGTDYSLDQNLKGDIDATVASTVRLHADFTPYLEKTNAHVEAVVQNGQLLDFAPLSALADYFGEENVKNIRFGRLENIMDFTENTIVIPKMEIASTLGYMNLSGRQSMDMQMEYYFQVPFNLVTRTVKNKLFGVKEVAPEEQQVIANDGKKRMYLNVKMTGTPEDYKIELSKKRDIASIDN